MQVVPYLHFNGNCDAAFKFYEQALGGKILMRMTYEGTPAAQHSPPELRDKILHARIQIGETIVMASDAPPGRGGEPNGFSLSIGFNSVAEAERAFHALAEKGQVVMPIGKSFFAATFGMLKDQFGMPWMVVCEKEG